MKSVLVVDDNRLTRELIADILEAFDYDVETAPDMTEALEKIREKPPDAIVLDVGSPEMNGEAFIRDCRKDQACAQIPIAILTPTHEGSRTQQLGVQARIRKPFSTMELLRTVQRLTGETVDADGQEA
jgi:CheY-like chemotaxis protein